MVMLNLYIIYGVSVCMLQNSAFRPAGSLFESKLDTGTFIEQYGRGLRCQPKANTLACVSHRSAYNKT